MRNFEDLISPIFVERKLDGRKGKSTIESLFKGNLLTSFSFKENFLTKDFCGFTQKLANHSENMFTVTFKKYMLICISFNIGYW